MGIFSSKTKGEIDKLIEENDELKNTLHILQQKSQGLAEVEQKLSDSKKELIELLKQIDEYKNQIQNYTEETSNRSERFHEINQTIQELEIKKELLYNEVGNLEASSQLSEEKFREIVLREKEVDLLEEKKAALVIENADLEDSLAQLRTEYENLRDRLNEMKIEEERINSFLSKFGGAYDESLIKAKESETELNERLNQLKNEEIKRNSIVKQLDEKITLSEEIKSNLESSLSAIITQLSEKEKLFNEFSLKRDNLLDELRFAQKEYDEFDAKYNFARDTIQKLETESRDLIDKKNILLEDITRLENVKSELQEKVLKYKSDEENLSSRIEEKQRSVEMLEKRKLDLEENQLKIENNVSQIFTKFTEELIANKNRLNSIRHDVLEKEKELVSKERVLLEKSTQVAEYGGLTKVLQKERAGIEQLIASLKEEARILNDGVLKTKASLTDELLRLSNLKTETENSSRRKEIIQQELMKMMGELNKEYASLSQNKSGLDEEIKIRRKELEDLVAELGIKKNLLAELKEETAKIETQKEEYTAKITELIAMEKNLRFKSANPENEFENKGQSVSNENEE